MPTPKLNRRHFMGMSRSGVLLEDRNAFELDEELITDVHKMSFDDDRQVRFYRMRQEGIPPALEGYAHLYTGGTKPVARDGWWLLTKSQAIYAAAAAALSERKRLGLLSNRKMGLMVAAAGFAIFLACLVLVGYDMKLTATQEVTPNGIVTQTQGEAINGAGDGSGAAPEDTGASPEPGSSSP